MAACVEPVEPFINPGQCSMPDCEVTLKFDEDESPLYVCKHPLVNLGGYFKSMFLSECKERDENVIRIGEVSRSDMLIFLQFAVPVEKFEAPKPSKIRELYTLIKLADRFSCQKLLQEIATNLPKLASGMPPHSNNSYPYLTIETTRELLKLFSLGDILLTCDLNQAIAKHILCNEIMYEQVGGHKLALVKAAYEHRGSSTAILETCIRLCATLQLRDVEESLQQKGMDGLAFAIYNTIDAATPTFGWGPLTQDTNQHRGSDCRQQRFDGVRVTNGHWWWHCSKCGVSSQDEATMPFEEVMQIKIKKSLLA